MQPREVIGATKDGRALTDADLEAWLGAYLRKEIPDYQMSAWLMAVFFKGLTPRETATLTRALWKSGITFPRDSDASYWIDKHSTGGVGDKTSLLLVPILSVMTEKALGVGNVRIPMVSGRALGHSGGTLDKLESVDGFSPRISVEKALTLLGANGFFMMGQTDDFCPLDRMLYALRDVTATVESRPLIVSSIMSKKLAENLDGLVIDVKVGSGAFMKSLAEGRALASALVEVAKLHEKDAVAVITTMDEPLGTSVGNRLEVLECWHYLTGEEREDGLHEVTRELAAWMFHLASRRKTEISAARELYDTILNSEGERVRAVFKKMFAAQGGNLDAFLAKKDSLPIFLWRAEHEGYLERMDAYHLGVLLNRLGGGRSRKEDAIDPDVGIRVLARVGDKVDKGQVLAQVFYRRPEDVSLCEMFQKRAVTVVSAPPKKSPWVREVV